MNIKRNLLTAAVLAGLIGSASAVNVSPDGLGQVLFYPYYTTNANNITLLTVTNTTDNAKAVKVRFLESMNSREVLDFNLYLSAHDVWSAAVVDDDGVPTLIVQDTTCSAPYIYETGPQPFLPFALTDGGPTTIDRATEGHIEIIEMGTITGDSAKAITHEVTQAGEQAHPTDCNMIIEAWSNINGVDGYWLDDPSTDITAPSGGLFGAASIINVQEGTMYSYDAKAINGFATQVQGKDYLHQQPGTDLPSLNSGDVTSASVFADDGTVIQSVGLTRGVDAISFVFMHENLMNEYALESSLNAATEWVITFPTKSFYVDPAVTGSATPLAPFTSVWNGETACEVVLLDSVYDREEQTLPDAQPGSSGPIVSPAPPPVIGDVAPPFELCYETTVIQFGDSNKSILGSFNPITIDPEAFGFSNGWLSLELDDYGHDANADGVLSSSEANLSRDSLGGLEGLPAVGFALQRFVNGSLVDSNGNPIRANYGSTFQHKASRKLTP